MNLLLLFTVNKASNTHHFYHIRIVYTHTHTHNVNYAYTNTPLTHNHPSRKRTEHTNTHTTHTETHHMLRNTQTHTIHLHSTLYPLNNTQKHIVVNQNNTYISLKFILFFLSVQKNFNSHYIYFISTYVPTFFLFRKTLKASG